MPVITDVDKPIEDGIELAMVPIEQIVCEDRVREDYGNIQELAQSIGMKVMIPAGQDGVGTTHAGHRYDHFLISPDLANEEAVGCHIRTFTGGELDTAKKVSDHLPVLAEFRTDSKFKDRR